MSGYSKIKRIGSKRFQESPKSPDLLTSPQESPKHVSRTIPRPSPKSQKDSDTTPKNGSKNSPRFGLEVDDDGEKGERFGMVLNRANSVSSGSRRYKYDNHGKSSVQSAVRRAFSASRSSSVSERYSRIHDQGMTMGYENDHDEEYIKNDGDSMNNKLKKKSKSGKILKACKSLFRF